MRKIKEAFTAVRIEQMLTKDEILELYLNKIYLLPRLRRGRRRAGLFR